MGRVSWEYAVAGLGGWQTLLWLPPASHLDCLIDTLKPIRNVAQSHLVSAMYLLFSWLLEVLC